MKRQLRQKVVPKLVVTVEVDYKLTDVAAVRCINTPDSISSKHKLDSVYEDIFDDVALTVLNTVVSYGFEVTDNYQADRTYSYYVKFNPLDYNGNRATKFEVAFRISDHKPNMGVRRSQNPSTIVIKSINLGKYKFKDFDGVFSAVEDICKCLRRGDVDVLFRYGANL